MGHYNAMLGLMGHLVGERPTQPEPSTWIDRDGDYPEDDRTDDERAFDRRLATIARECDVLSSHVDALRTLRVPLTDANLSTVTCLELLLPRLTQLVDRLAR